MKKILNVEGMHCNSCKLLLEKSISTVSNVQKVNANVSQGTLSIDYNKELNFDEIRNIVHECGYKVVEEKIYRPWFSKNIKDYKTMIISLLGFIFLYFLLSSTGLFSFDITSQGSPSLGLVLLIGLTAGFSSCMAVVGGLVLAISSKWNKQNEEQKFSQRILPHIRFNTGRIVGFAVLGGILGVFGSVISLSPFMMSVMTLIVGGIMILLGINLTQISPRLSSFSLSLPTGKLFNRKETGVIQNEQKKTGIAKYAAAFGSGILTFFLPCGFTFAMQLYAMSTGNFWMGMLIMTLFALGTLPGLLGIGSLTSIFKGKTAKIAYQAIGVLVILLGLYNISNSYGVVKTNISAQGQKQTTNQAAEVITMTYTDKGFTPNLLTLQAGKSYKIVINVETTVYGCMSTVYIPGLDEHIQSVTKGNQIVFNVQTSKPGEYDFVCAMGLYHGAKIIVK